MSSTSNVVEMPNRYPDTVIETILSLTIDDLCTLALCQDEPLTDSQAKENRARMNSVAHLLNLSLIEFNDSTQAWELNETGNTVLRAIHAIG